MSEFFEPHNEIPFSNPKGKKWVLIINWVLKLLVTIATSVATVLGVEACTALPA